MEKSTVGYLGAHPSRALLYAYFNRSGSKEPFSFPGATCDRFRCTVEPSPGHIWGRDKVVNGSQPPPGRSLLVAFHTRSRCMGPAPHDSIRSDGLGVKKFGHDG